MNVIKIPFFLNSLYLQELARSSIVGWGTILQAGRAIAQAISRWLPTTAARVRARVWQVGFVVDKLASEVFSEYFGIPCQSHSFHQLLHPHNHPGQVQ
jgi:hypothetical protein